MRRWTLVLALVSAPVAQQPQLPAEVVELADTLDRVHRGNSDQEITQFSALLQLDTLAPDQDAVSITLDAKFGVFTVGSRTRRYIKYRVQEEGKLVERGRSEDRYWTRIDNEVVSLTAARHEIDIQAIDRDIRLARQLLEYLDPGDVVRRLRDVEPVESRELKLGRAAAVPCKVIRGTVDAFPLYYLGGEAGRAYLELWIEEDSGRLVAAGVTPMTEYGGRDMEHGEFVKLDKPTPEPNTGILLPGSLKIFTVSPDGVRMPQLQVGLRRIDLAPGLEPKDFLP